MKYLKPLLLLNFVVSFFYLSLSSAIAQEKDELKSFSDIIKNGTKTEKGLMTLHLYKSKLYIEIPYNKMEVPMLMAGRISSISNNQDAIAGYMPSDPRMVKWTEDGNKVYLHILFSKQMCDSTESIFPGVEKNNIMPVFHSFPIMAVNEDSTAVLVDGSKFFIQDKDPFTPILKTSGFAALLGKQSIKAKYIADHSGIVDIQAFPNNINVKTRMVYETNNRIPSFTAEMTISFMQLPEKVMRPRYCDPALGFFTDNKLRFSENKDYLENLQYVNRWNIAPKAEDLDKYKNGELVEPEKPIVFYVDSAFPEKWRPWLKEGIEDWQMAFEKIGFKNAIVAKDYPDDPDFNPEDIRNTCLIYSSSQTANAMGPSWTDPRSGEILQASVYFYHNVLSLLHDWRFVQTAAADPSARGNNYDMTVMGPLLRYLVVHEVGHTLGLMHNMRGSYAFPVDSLRSPSFTSKYGTTSSIMDYARFNYVAQPGDGVTHFLTPRLGQYDYYVIEWAYKPIFEANTPEEEVPILRSWIEAKGDDPIYMYGPQAIFGSSDPASQSESLGDDPIKASEYGINNLKIITKNLIEWFGEEDDTYKSVVDMRNTLFAQFKRYIIHVRTCLGGCYEYHNVIGDGKKSYTPVPKDVQKAALNFIYEQMMELPQWFNLPEVNQVIGPQNKNIATEFQLTTLRSMLNFGYISKFERYHRLSGSDYSSDEYLNDIFNLIWRPTIDGKAPTLEEQTVQLVFIQSLLSGLNMTDIIPSSSSSFTLSEELKEYRELYPFEWNDLYYAVATGKVEIAPINKSDNEFKMKVPSIAFKYLNKTLDLLKKKASSSKGEISDHYQYLYYELDKALNR